MKFNKIAAAVVALSVSAAASAAAPTTVAELSTGISFADVGLGILAVAGALITLAVLKKGARQVLSFIGR
ncbi:hypothetical protein [Pseudoduganella dura]|uniref:hypothetical protein n=1 Tax=Pseudoduganella dura TaxID=321982 RepID=UPI001671B89C|nr:hypothetical protein [Pseudoduganella dura]GGY21272.1 hypothetical protein GCM10007386_57590 [Pseudoduganella dura]